MPSPFEELYTTLQSSKLYEIIENGDNYQAEAVEAARTELLRRTLNEKEIETELDRRRGLREELLKEKEEKKVKLLSQDDIEAYEMALDHPDWQIDKIHDIQLLSAIKSAAIFTTLITALTTLLHFGSISYTIRELFYYIDLFNILYLTNFACGIVGPLLLYKQHKVGWFISLAFASSTFFLQYSSLRTAGLDEYLSFSFYVIECIAFIILSLVSISYLMRKNIRTHFAVKNGLVALAMIAGLLLNFGYIWIYINNR